MSNQITQILFIYTFVAAIFLFAFAAYIIEGYGLSRMAEKSERENGWMGFIPIVRRYLEGTLIGDTSFIRHTRIWMVSVPFAIILLLPAGWIAALVVFFAIQVFYGFIRYEFFKKYSRNALIHAILSTVIPFYFSIVIAVFGIK